MVGAKPPARGGLRPKMAVPGVLKTADKRYVAAVLFAISLPVLRPSSLHFIAFIVAASSDASLRLLAFEPQNKKWHVVSILEHHHAPVLSLQHECLYVKPSRASSRVVVSSGEASSDWHRYTSPDAEATSPAGPPSAELVCLRLVVSGGTDGSIAVWDVTHAVDDFLGRLAGNCMGRSNDDRAGADAAAVQLRRKPAFPAHSEAKAWEPEDGSGSYDAVDAMVVNPLHVFFNAHQSGVNAISSFTKIDGGRAQMTILSGGDDQSLFIGTLSLKLAAGMAANAGEDHQSMKTGFYEFLKSENDGETQESSRVSHRTTHDTTSRRSSQPLGCLSVDAAPQVRDRDERLSTSAIGTQHLPRSSPPIFSVRAGYAGCVPNAHASAVRGVWTDGELAFTTGLDQRLRCWRWTANLHGEKDERDRSDAFRESGDGALTEERWVVTEVPEPTGLDVLRTAEADGRTHYSVAIGGRGVQVIEYFK